MKKHSRYEQKFARRRRAGQINYSLPVDRDGQPTLNQQNFVYTTGTKEPKTHNFSRIRRADEV
jgi:hypothetical protein